jgi:hypothetical protein
MSSSSFVQAVSTKFDRDEHNHLLRHFFHIQQMSSSVTEYLEQFSDIVHQLHAHDPSFSPTVITNRFIDCLKKEIRASVMMHRPPTLDTASSLALLQEEATQDTVMERSKYNKKAGFESRKSWSTSVTSPTRSFDDKKVS